MYRLKFKKYPLFTFVSFDGNILRNIIFTILIDLEIYFSLGSVLGIFCFLFVLQWQKEDNVNKIPYYTLLIVRAPASYKISRTCLNRVQGMQLNIQEILASLSRKEAYFQKILSSRLFKLMFETYCPAKDFLFLSIWFQWRLRYDYRLALKSLLH